MAKLSNAELVRMLQAAAKDEHAAIIQYLRHAYLMGEGELACEIEGIAREEMRHFWMLSRWIVKLGGEPTITRGFTDLDGVTVPDWMRRDVAAEDRAIVMYTNYLTKIEDPDLRADIEHILADEVRHNGDFNHFIEKAEAELLAEAGSEEEMAEVIAAIDEEALNWGVGHEYAALLQYLMHSFKLHQADGEVSSQLEMQAINEMQHLGWFGEELAEHGKEMPLEHHGVTLPAKMREMLAADIQLEQETSAMYGEYLIKMEDEDLKGVVDDARGQELYHESLFSRLLKRADDLAAQESSETSKPSRPSWTIGTLKKGE